MILEIEDSLGVVHRFQNNWPNPCLFFQLLRWSSLRYGPL